MDNLAKDEVRKLDSFIEDTPDLLRKFEEVNANETLPPGSKPYAIDIKSFYTNILVREGIEAFRETLQRKDNISVRSSGGRFVSDSSTTTMATYHEEGLDTFLCADKSVTSYGQHVFLISYSLTQSES